MNIRKDSKLKLTVCGFMLMAICTGLSANTKNDIAAEKGLADYSEYRLKNKHTISHIAKTMYKKGKPYKNYIETVATKHDIPLEIYALPAIESEYREKVPGTGTGLGMWQMTPRAAREMGLTVNKSVDERKDWKKSTNAALEYIKKNAERNFDNNYDLAVLSYYAGAGTVNRAIKRNNTDNIWVLIQDKSVVKNDSKMYIFKYMAYAEEYKKLNDKDKL